MTKLAPGISRAARQLRRWTQAEVDRAARLRRSGVPVNEIAAELGRSRRSVKSILYQPRVRPHRGGYFSPAYAGPPLARCPEDERLIKSAVEGSRKLLDAILRAQHIHRRPTSGALGDRNEAGA